QTVRVGLSTPRIEENIHRLLALRKARGQTYPKVRVGMVLIRENMHEAELFLKKWRGVADYVGLGGFSTRIGSVNLSEVGSSATHEKHPCAVPFRELNIWSDGKAVLCCEDWNEEHVTGDPNTQTLQEIWHGAILREARRLHSRLQGEQIALCARCNVWRKPSAGARLWV